MTSEKTAKDKLKAAINIDRASELYKLMKEQDSGCVFLAPLNLYTAHNHVFPRDIVENIVRMTKGDLSINTNDIFPIWHEFLPSLGMKIEKVIIQIPQFSINGRPAAEVIQESSDTPIRISTAKTQEFTPFDPDLAWMILLQNLNNFDAWHVLSTEQAKHSTAYTNTGGQAELDFYEKQGWIVVASIGVKITDSPSNQTPAQTQL